MPPEPLFPGPRPPVCSIPAHAAGLGGSVGRAAGPAPSGRCASLGAGLGAHIFLPLGPTPEPKDGGGKRSGRTRRGHCIWVPHFSIPSPRIQSPGGLSPPLASTEHPLARFHGGTVPRETAPTGVGSVPALPLLWRPGSLGMLAALLPWRQAPPPPGPAAPEPEGVKWKSRGKRPEPNQALWPLLSPPPGPGSHPRVQRRPGLALGPCKPGLEHHQVLEGWPAS